METRTIEVKDPVSGEVKAIRTQSRRDPNDYWTTLSHTSFDLDDVQPWQSYTVNYQPWTWHPVIVATEAVLDDGSIYRVDDRYFGALGGFPVKSRQTATLKDASGRLDFVTDTILVGGQDGRAGPLPDYRTSAQDYDTATGQLDFTVVTYVNRTVATDYDSATGRPIYSVTTYHRGIYPQDGYYLPGAYDGHYLAEAYDSAGRLDYTHEQWADGRSVAKDYDAATGQVDFITERQANGRVIATDYDLADAYPWAAYQVVYNAAGVAESWGPI